MHSENLMQPLQFISLYCWFSSFKNWNGPIYLLNGDKYNLIYGDKLFNIVSVNYTFLYFLNGSMIVSSFTATHEFSNQTHAFEIVGRFVIWFCHPFVLHALF